MDSILNTVKTALGVEADYNGFDTNILLDINTAIWSLNQLGVGPSSGFKVIGENETWDNLLVGKYASMLESAKSYIFQKVRLSFDPPNNSYLVDAIQKQIQELEWRLMVQVEIPVVIDENILLNKKDGMLGKLPFAIDYGANGLFGLHRSGVVLAGPINRAYYNGTDDCFTNIYSPEFAALFDGDEITAIIRGKVNSLLDWNEFHELLVFYSYPFANGLTINISPNGNAIECTYMNSSFPPNFTRTVACNDLDWMTLGIRASNLAGTFYFDINGVQQGGSVGNPLWTQPLWEWGARIGNPRWNGWASDCIISFGVVATAQQMLTIHTKLDTGILTTSDLDTIFGVGKYAWWKLDED